MVDHGHGRRSKLTKELVAWCYSALNGEGGGIELIKGFTGRRSDGDGPSMMDICDSQLVSMHGDKDTERRSWVEK
jgi:hypothetical protein